MVVIANDEKVRLLERVPLFAQLGAADIEAIARVASNKTVKPRQELFHKGDPGSQVYVVLTGKLKVITTSDEGDDVMFSVVDPGELLGEIALLGDRPRTATVVAIQESHLLVIDRRDFLPLLRSRPEVAIEMLSVVSGRLARVSEFIEDTHFLNLPVRLAKKLTHFAGSYGRDQGDGGVLIDLKLSQQEWGDLVGTTRESVNKQFKTWGEEGLIRLEKGKVVLQQPAELERLAGCVVY